MGEKAGHPFRGNQFSKSKGGGKGASAAPDREGAVSTMPGLKTLAQREDAAKAGHWKRGEGRAVAAVRRQFEIDKARRARDMSAGPSAGHRGEALRMANDAARAQRSPAQIDSHIKEGSTVKGPAGEFTAGRTMLTRFGPLVENRDKPGQAFALQQVKYTAAERAARRVQQQRPQLKEVSIDRIKQIRKDAANLLRADRKAAAAKGKDNLGFSFTKVGRTQRKKFEQGLRQASKSAPGMLRGPRPGVLANITRTHRREDW